LKEIIVTGDNKNQRLDKFLLKYLNEAPKGFVYKMLRKKNIKLNGGKASGNELLEENDVINIYLTDETFLKFSSQKQVALYRGEVDVIYEDRHVLAVNKPRGILTHPDSPNQENTMLGIVLGHLHSNGSFDISRESVFTPAFCNRLDMNTTGALVCAKTLGAAQQLNHAVSGQGSVKTYCAIVIGEVAESGVLRGFMEKQADSNISSLSERGKEVITEYKPITAKNGYSLLEIKLVTGRSHQIRVHMASIGHPVLGDKKYGGAVSNGPRFQMLHAKSLYFQGLEGDLTYLSNKTFEAKEPEDFLKWKRKLLG